MQYHVLQVEQSIFSCHFEKKQNLMNGSNTANVDISYFIEPQEVTGQCTGKKIVHMKNSSKKNTPKRVAEGKKYFCLIMEAKHILMLFEQVLK